MVDPGTGVALATLAKDILSGGGVFKELGLILGNEVRLRRFCQELKIPERARKMAEKAGYEPGVVPLKILAPLVAHAALEETSDEDMCERWAALLANAARPDQDSPYFVSFPGILGQLSPTEVVVLDDLYERGVPNGKEWGHLPEWVSEATGLPEGAIAAVIDSLIGHGLVNLEPSTKADDKGYLALTAGGQCVRISALGRRFVEACQPPAEG